MIYFDNASTGGFKPHSVIENATTVMRFLSANPNRSGHRLALTGMEILHNTRTIVGKLFSCQSDRVIFTKNCTESLNMAIFGSLQVGGHVITTVFEHNSVLRPLHALKEKGLISLDIVKPYEDKDVVQAIKEKINSKTYLIVCNSVSNVNGHALPIEKIGLLAKDNNLLFLVDGAQGGGHIFLDMKKQNVSMLALAGHKGLCGIMTSGLLLLNDNVEIEPFTYGGTGSESFSLNQPNYYPERLESGTLNLPAISSLYEGVKHIMANRENFAVHLLAKTKTLIDGLEKIDGVKLFSTPNESGIVAFKLDNMPSNEVSDILNSEYDVAVRGGLHCAPLMHKFLGSGEDGLVRASLAVQNSSNEISYFLRAINQIANK